MTKEEKYQLVQELTEKLKTKPNVFIADCGGLSVAQVNELRGICYKENIEMQVVKNTLLRKAMEATDLDYSGLFDALKQPTAVFFVDEAVNGPAKVIKKFRDKGTRPALKAAYVDEAVFLGDSNLDMLASLKSKQELLGDIIGLLQSPAKNLISALQSGGPNKVAGLVKALEERA